MKRPLLAVALGYTAGVLLGEWLHPGLVVLFVAGGIAATAALAWGKMRIWFLAVLLVIAGWVNMNRHAEAISPNDLRTALGSKPEDVKLRGTICSPPVARIFERGAAELWHTAAVVDTTEVFRDGHWQPAAGKVLATTSGVLDSTFGNGQGVEISGVISPLRGPLAEGLFNPRQFYMRQEVYCQLPTGSTNAWLATGDAGKGALAERFSAWARRTLALGMPVEDEAQRLMWTLALDWKAPLIAAVEEPFLRAGTFHIFAVDGLRIGLLTAVGLGLLRVLRIPRALAGLVLIPAIWFYVALTGWPASAVRAAVMMTIVIVGWVIKRPGDLFNSLLAAALIVLLWNPQQLFQAGFQLSFLIVLCIAVVALPMREFLLARLFPPDKFLPDELRAPWQVGLERARRWLIDVFVMSLAAFLGSLPLTAYYFHLFTPVGVPANMVVVPLTGLALISCLASLLTGGWFPAVAIFFNHSAWLWLKCIIAVSVWSARWHTGNWYVAAPRPITFVCYYAILLAVFTGWIFRTRHKKAGVAGFLALAALWVADSQWQRGLARIDVLALRGAPAVFVAGAGTNRNLLADCGDTTSADGIVKPFLHAQGINRLGEFCLTAGYQQSVGGADIVLTNFSPGSVFAGPARVRSPAYRRVTGELEQTPGFLKSVQDGDGVAGWTVLYPRADDKFAAADEVSLVLSRSINGHSILLLPALGLDGQRLLMDRHPDLRAEIVMAGLPSRDEPLDEPLLEMLQPKLIIVADSEVPATRRASAKLRQRLEQHRESRVLYCHDAGSLTLLLRRNGWQLRNASGENLGGSSLYSVE